MKIEKRIERFEIIPRIRKKKYALQHVEILLGIIRALSLSLSNLLSECLESLFCLSVPLKYVKNP